MKTSDFDYDLPKELIAQHPTDKRVNSRLLVVHKNTGELEHRHFYNITDYFHKGDVLVRNNTKVIPARLFGTKEPTGAAIEILLLKDLGDDTWQCLVRNAKKITEGTFINFHNGLLRAECLEIQEKGLRKLKMHYSGSFFSILEQLGNIPLPPYIHEKPADPDRYQTVYAKIKGSAAAPTAGLHFTDEIFAKLKAMGVIIVDVTLHVGLGTFRPMDTENIEEHVMHSEYYQMSQETADILNAAKQENRRIISVGTTSTRTLESVYQKYHTFCKCHGETSIFIYPGYQYQAIDAIITNFHLPKSTLIMMISAFCSRELIFKAYKEAIAKEYRFFSFGDAMLITNE